MSAVDTAAPAAAPTEGGPLPARQSVIGGLAWLMWRQQRLVVVAWLTVVVLAAVAFPPLRSAMADFIAAHHIAGCAEISLDPHCQGEGTQQAVAAFRARYSPVLTGVGLLLTALPVVIGTFVAAPLLSREYESGTWRLVLGQSVSRAQWVAAKLVAAALPAALGSAALMALYRWMWQPSANFVSGVAWSSRQFAVAGGPLLIATILLAVAVGALVGGLTRRVVPAMAATGGAVLALQYVLATVRPYLWPWRTEVVSRSELPNDVWGFGQGFLTGDGRRLPYDYCSGASDVTACTQDAGVTREFTDLHRMADYWPLQGVESGICLALAAALAGFLLWRARRGA
ncbi:ABC transporter permease subunit [Kitasatospora paranensis]|uniref:ABC transporter permease subunit n=1 Tax=Kitasatospora paranensis TaxID=258053 RepID=A0ABW2G5F4_9ACTN